MRDKKIEKYYLNLFISIANKLNSELQSQYHINISAGLFLDSVVLKLWKNHWIDKNTGSSVFFSVWLDDKGILDERFYYNIHALKLRKLSGYRIESRKFASAFRERFRKFEKLFPDVSIDFGPLTLMQGYADINEISFENDVNKLISNFLLIEFIIDELLEIGKINKNKIYDKTKLL